MRILLSRSSVDQEHEKQLAKTGFWGKKAAGCVFYARDSQRFLIARRSGAVQEPNTWGTFGGACDPGEAPPQTVRREAEEECGYSGELKLVPLYLFKHESGFEYHNYLAVIPTEFRPKLNWENRAAAWVGHGEWQHPMHPGLPAVIAAIDKLYPTLKAKYP